MTATVHPHRRLMCQVFLLVAATFLGCSSADDAAIIANQQSVQPELDHLELAIEYLDKRDELDAQKSAELSSFHLNRWIKSQGQDPDWIEDRLISQLPSFYRSLEDIVAVSESSFGMSDVMYLEESKWLHRIADWATGYPLDADMESWLATTAAERSVEVSDKLRTAIQMFDWTVRNIQLEHLVEYPKSQSAGPTSETPNLVNPDEAMLQSLPPAARGDDGPGYTYLPWHVLLYGRGDAYQRARIFILLARQHKLDVVMLATNPSGAPRPEPWVAALVLDNELFLFDPQLGLPIPAQDSTGVATLAQALDDPAILTSLSVGTEYVYPVTGDKLKGLVALVDAAPEALSQRMKLLERALAATDRPMVLTVTPSQVARRVRETNVVSSVKIWMLPIDTLLYQAFVAHLLSTDSEARARILSRESIFWDPTPLSKARRQHLQGIFDDADDVSGAKTYYLQSRTADNLLDRMETSQLVQQRMGMAFDPQTDTPESWQMKVTHEKMLRTQAKQHASYWLGLIQFEQQNFDVAINWLERRSLEADPDGPWAAGSRRNLARCLEQIGQLEKARTLYLQDNSAQAHGSLLNARRLRKKLEETAGTTGDDEA